MSLRLAMVVGLAAAAAGCSSESLSCLIGGCDDASDVPVLQGCWTDADCEANQLGEVCRRADGTGAPTAIATDGGSPALQGICVIPSQPGSSQVYLEVRPIGESPLPTTQLGPVDTSKGQNQELVVPAPVTLAGTVRYRGREDLVAGARVRFRTRPLIPGRSLSFDATTGAAGATEGVFGATLPQASYSVVVQPPDRSGVQPPPERPLGDSLTEILSASGNLSFEVTPLEELLSVTGTAWYERTSDGRRMPAANLEVWALDASATTGTARSLAQSVRTDAQGRFTLWLPALPTGTTAWDFRLQFTPPPNTVAFPTYTVGHWQASEAMDLGELKIGKLPVLDEISGTVFDASASGASESKPVAGARVAFQAKESEPFSFSATATTDNAGKYTIKLLRGQYTAIAVPPVDRASTGILPFAPCPYGDKFTPEPNLVINFACARRLRLHGEVFTPVQTNLRKLPGVTVEAVRRPDAELGDELRDTAVTDENGEFDMPLAPGVYDVIFKPPPDAKLPYKRLPQPLVLKDRGRALGVQLDEPFELFGKLVSGRDGMPVEATLDAFLIDGTGATATSRQVGRGVSQADGSYSIVLPGAD